jgi:hypothetical protein
MATTISPLNTFLGAGVIKIKTQGSPTWWDVGEAVRFQVTAGTEAKDYMSARHGIRRKARTVAINRTLSTFAGNAKGA